MVKHDSDLYLTQKSLTEWLEDINHRDSEALRAEDNDKRERLAVLKRLAHVPYDEQVKFSARDIADNTPDHAKFVSEHGDDLCALRLIPRDPSLPKLRMRGWSVKKVQDWFHEQKIDPDMYRAEYMPHAENEDWGTIFIVTEKGVSGEIIRGSHSQLTQGIYETNHRPCTFFYDFKNWQMQPFDAEALEEMKKTIEALRFSVEQQKNVTQELGSTFTHDYLMGYFETTDGPQFGLRFIDYSTKMAALLPDAIMPTKGSALVHGQVGFLGQASGPVHIVQPGGSADSFPEGAVLVSEMTTPDLVIHMQKACAIVTDNGGILSHAAIVARELKKPCIVGTRNATLILQDGDMVFVDGKTGNVEKIEGSV